MKNFLISVIITNYNSKKFLIRSIKSVLEQSYQTFELLVIDDCSTDNSYINAKKYFEWFKTNEVKEIINNFKVKDKQLFFYNYNQ